MPQVHNKAVMTDTTSAFGKNSRYMASLRFTEKSLKRVHVLSTLENRMTKKKLDFFERDSQTLISKFDRIKNRLVENLNKRLAYKLVLKNHSISNAKDYHKALDQKYTLTALQGEVKTMMQAMKPQRIRERKARSLVHEQQNSYDNIIFENSQKFNKLFPEKKTWMSRRVREMLEQQAKEEVKEPTPIPTREQNRKKGLAALRRRIITIDDSKPNSPLKLPKTPAISPTKTPSLSKPQSQSNSRLSKRQEISMSMMKSQKSFTEGREATKDDIIVAMETRMKSLNINETEKNKKDINNNEIVDNTEIDSAETKLKADEKGDSVLPKPRADDKRETLLPPIATPKERQSKSQLPTEKTKVRDNVKLPALKMSKSVKVY